MSRIYICHIKQTKLENSRLPPEYSNLAPIYSRSELESFSDNPADWPIFKEGIVLKFKIPQATTADENIDFVDDVDDEEIDDQNDDLDDLNDDLDDYEADDLYEIEDDYVDDFDDPYD